MQELVQLLNTSEDPTGYTAREAMEDQIAPEEDVPYYMPTVKKKVEEPAPPKPNGYSDGSLKNNKGLFWAVGGAGVWWPNRSLESLTPDEKKIAEHCQVEPNTCIIDSEATVNPGGSCYGPLSTPSSTPLLDVSSVRR